MILILKKRLPLLAAASAAFLGGGAAVVALLDQGAWAQILLAASVVSLAVLGLGIFVRLGDLFRLEQREAARDRSVDERRHLFEHDHERWRRISLEEERWRRTMLERVPSQIDGSIQRGMQLLGDRSNLQADLLEQTLRASIEVIRDDIGRDVRQQLFAQEQALVTELDALQQIHQRFPIDGPAPLLGGWALSPAGLLQVLDLAAMGPVRTVVECGCGASTIYLAWLLRDRPGAKVVSLEHSQYFAEATRDRLRNLGLRDIAEVRFAPLEPTNVHEWNGGWYALDAVRDLADIDLLLVDGPPGSSGFRARYPALPVLDSKMSPEGLIILDDVNRTDEETILKTWLGSKRWTNGYSSTSRQAVLHRGNVFDG